MAIERSCKNCKNSMNNKRDKEPCDLKCGYYLSAWELFENTTTKIIDSIDMIRTLGKEYCVTDGNNHYSEIRKDKGVDAIEIAIKNNVFEDFAITNIVKYALRFKKTRNKDDLKKIADYAHLLCGVEINKEE